MGILQDRVIVVTGAGRGIGREHALLFAREGAKVVVNDLGGGTDGTGATTGPAQEVVEQIQAAGGEAVANTDDVASASGADNLIRTALDTFGSLHGLVNNAGILRDAMLFNMDDEDWELSLKVNAGGHFYPTRAAARYWREQSKAGTPVASPAVVNTASESGIFSNAGQSNYAAAKAGVASLTAVWHKELTRYDVRVNGICPRAATRLTAQVGVDEVDDPNVPFHPANISPWVAFLLSPECPINGEVFVVFGGMVQRAAPWSLDPTWKLLKKDGPWKPADFAKAVAELGVPTNESRNTGGIR